MSVDTRSAPDSRIDGINSLVARLVAGEYTARGTPSSRDDGLDQLMQGVNQLAEALLHQQTATRETEQHGAELLDVMMRMAALDYTNRAPIRNGEGIVDALATGLNLVIDELVAAQEAQRQLQDEIIHTQAASIQELSTPLIPISDDVLVMPLIGAIDSARAQQVLERLLTGIAESQAHTAILDITGVSVVDTQVANALIRAAQAVQLLGARIVLTGIRPEVAQTLVGLGVDLQNIVTRSTLQTGIAYTMRENDRMRAART